jgi:protein phosphatase
MNYLWASATDTGRVRDHNEDAVFPSDIGVAAEGLVAGVADGMGGHIGGEIASAVALEAAVAVEGDPRTRVDAANRAVVDRAAAEPELAGMGTTLTLAVLESDGTLELAHVGDSRAYLYRAGNLIQLTRDHSLVAEMVEAGHLHPDDAADHPYRSIVTRALGLDRRVEIDVVTDRLESGDRLILCSDGLSGMVPDADIAVLLERATEPHDAAASLVEAANAAGGVDNVTVVVVDAADDAHN